MKRLCILWIAPIALMLVACTEGLDGPASPSYGFEIFLTKDSLAYTPSMGYDTIALAAIELADNPLVAKMDIESYDTLTHTITLRASKELLPWPRVPVHGRMFVVTVDRVPIYCGFLWAAYSSVPCGWIYIEVTASDANGLEENQIEISAGYPNGSHFHGQDPRSDPRVLNCFR